MMSIESNVTLKIILRYLKNLLIVPSALNLSMQSEYASPRSNEPEPMKVVKVFKPTSQPTISVLIADDHKLVRDMMSLFIAAQDDFEVSVAQSYDEARAALEANGRIDVILLDAKMPGMLGVVSVQDMVRDFPDSAVVTFSGTSSNAYVQECLRVGTKGYIPKTLPFQSLLSAIRLIASGEIFVPSSFSHANTDSEKLSSYNISEPELKVLRRVCVGWSNKEIARDAGTTEVTVKMHMRSICNKLNAKNRTQAAVIALREEIT